ncbi:retropepsin-like aspartic protease family protein [Sphingomonas sp.]|uniref:retropepsin-like aspartic protease family protein n=1 Tax=Sphingomonas sp. TaxID=28214 RepID=UPI003B3A0AEB
MNGNGADIAFYLLALILPLSALLSRRIPWRKALGLAGIWFVIFLTLFLIVGAGTNVPSDVWSKIGGIFREDEQHVTGGTMRLDMASDGHFWATASINGVSRRMLVDSGATTTSLSHATAKAAGLDLEQSPFPVQLDTANGMVMARTSSIDRLVIGPIQATDLRVVVSDRFGTDILGMNFLSRLGSWRVEDRTLILNPGSPG